MFDFKKLFADTNKYPDTMTFKIGDAEVSLGDMRQYDALYDGALKTELQKQQAALEADKGKVNEASNKVAKMFVDLQQKEALLQEKMKQTQPQPNADPLAQYADDPVFKPVVSRMSAIEQKLQDSLKAVDDKLQQLTQATAQMGTTMLGEKARIDFSALPTDDPDRPKDLTLDSLYKLAVEQRIYDGNNLPDLRAAYDRLTAPARQARQIKEAEQKGREAAMREIQEGAMLPRPVSGLPPLPEGYKPPVSMEDAFRQAGSDRDMWKQINTAQMQ